MVALDFTGVPNNITTECMCIGENNAIYRHNMTEFKRNLNHISQIKGVQALESDTVWEQVQCETLSVIISTF